MVGDAIRSALNQTYSPIEVLVVDNASTDTIEEVVNSFHDPRLKFVKNEKNLGLFGNFNRCIELAEGKYIHILHSDDYIDPHFTQTCVEFLESHAGVVMTFSSTVAVSGKEQYRICPFTQDQIFPAPEGFRQILKTRNLVSCPSVIVRKDVYNSVGLYSLEYPYSGDFYQWLRIAKRFDIAYVAGATLFYRQGKHSESFQLLFKSPLGYIDLIKIFIKVIDELGIDAIFYRNELNIAIRRHMRDCLFAGIVRSDLMGSYSPLIFIGFAFNTWGLIVTKSISDRLKKCFDFFTIIAIACIFCIPGGRSGARKILGKQDRY
jgi:glycosyltransferase involved in cell wall biosynthesis